MLQFAEDCQNYLTIPVADAEEQTLCRRTPHNAKLKMVAAAMWYFRKLLPLLHRVCSINHHQN